MALRPTKPFFTCDSTYSVNRKRTTIFSVPEWHSTHNSYREGLRERIGRWIMGAHSTHTVP